MISKPCPPRPELEALIRRAVEHHNAMTPHQRRIAMAGQRKSWVIGEMLLEHPEMTREHAEEIYDSL